MSHLALILLLAASPEPRTRVLVMPLVANEGINEGTANALSAAVVGEVRKRPGVLALTGTDVQAVISVEKQKALLTCVESSCLAEIGGALGADRVLTGSVSKLGESYLAHLQLVDARKAVVLHEADRRLKKGNVDDVLDALPAMVAELFGPPGPAQPAVATPSAPTAAPANPPAANPVPAPTPVAAKLAPPGVDEADPAAEPVRAKLTVVTDGQGHYLAFVPFAGFDAPFYAGTAEALHAQYVAGGGSSGNTEFSLNFWDPRTQRGAEAELDFKDGKYALTCGEKTIAFTALGPDKARAFLKKAKLDKARWRRQGIGLGRDDDGTYYYVDAPREHGNPDDLHLYLGHKGKVVPVQVTDVQREGALLLIDSDAGNLKLPLGEGEALKTPGSFKTSAGARAVTSLDLWSNRRMIYTALGAYAGERLGTACDPFLP
jgi:hypothetical protein